MYGYPSGLALHCLGLIKLHVRLNREVVQLFVGLVKDLVNRPLENK